MRVRVCLRKNEKEILPDVYAKMELCMTENKMWEELATNLAVATDRHWLKEKTLSQSHTSREKMSALLS